MTENSHYADSYSYCKPATEEHWLRWLRQYEFSYMLTLSVPSCPLYGVAGVPSNYKQGILFKDLVTTLVYRVSDHVFGRGGKSRELGHATFLEAWTKTGHPTFWHSHSLVQVPKSYGHRFEKQLVHDWIRLLKHEYRPETILLEEIYDKDKAILYCSKFASSSLSDQIISSALADI